MKFYNTAFIMQALLFGLLINISAINKNKYIDDIIIIIKIIIMMNAQCKIIIKI